MVVGWEGWGEQVMTVAGRGTTRLLIMGGQGREAQVVGMGGVGGRTQVVIVGSRGSGTQEMHLIKALKHFTSHPVSSVLFSDLSF